MLNFNWINESTIVEEDGRIEIYALKETDFSVTMAQLEQKVSRLNHCVTRPFTIQRWQVILS